ncbi:MAG: zinc-binding dehydrogenase [Planctomycetes bacterium]|nr:zinc-binding dehydrogenase [Planctomycetota bacterium]
MENYRVIVRAPRKVELERVPLPKPAEGQVLIRNRRSAISTGTELTYLTGEYPQGSVWARGAKYPMPIGYSAVGEVVETGPGVQGLQPGDRVISGTHHCHYALQAARYAQTVPNAVSDEVAALHRLAEIGMNSVRRGVPEWGECAVVFGLGIIGQLVAAFARLAGCRPVIGVDLSPFRRDIARKLGADVLLDGHAADLSEQLKAANHGRLADLVYEVTGVGELVTRQMDLLRRQGRIVIVSGPRTKTLIDLNDQCSCPSFSVIGAHYTSHPAEETPYNPWTIYRHAGLFLDHVARGELKAELLITHRYPWSDAPAAYDLLMRDRGQAGAVVLDWTAA